MSNTRVTEHKAAGRAHKREMRKVLTLEALELPLLPAAMNLALRVASGDRSAATDMAEAISKDQSLTGSILKIANSEHFGLAQDVPTVSRAILSSDSRPCEALL